MGWGEGTMNDKLIIMQTNLEHENFKKAMAVGYHDFTDIYESQRKTDISKFNLTALLFILNLLF